LTAVYQVQQSGSRPNAACLSDDAWLLWNRA